MEELKREGSRFNPSNLCRLSQNHEVIPVNDFLARKLAAGDLDRMKACDATGELGAVLVADADDLVLREVAFATRDAGREQAAAILSQSLLRAVVHEERALGMMEKGDPALAAGHLVRLRDEESAFFSAAENVRKHGGLPPAGDDERDARARDDLRRTNLRSHAADGRRAQGAARHAFDRVVNALDCRQQPSGGRAEAFDDAVHGGEDDEQVRWQERGDEGGEPVVVAELQLGEGDGVVLVDDGDDAAVEQGDERVAGVKVALMVFEIVVREEDLRDVEAELENRFS